MRGRFAGFALLLSVVLLGAFISGCINQSVQTETTSRPTETVTETKTETETTTSTETETETESPITDTKTPTDTETKTKTRTNAPTETPTETATQEPQEAQIDAKLKEVEEAIGLVDEAIESAMGQESFSNFAVMKIRAPPKEKDFHRLMELAGSEENKTKRLEYLSDAYLIRFAQLVSLRNAFIVAAVEGVYWDRVIKGEPLDEFYNENGIFIVDGKHVPAREMVHATLKAVEGKEIVSIEVYHPESGLRFIDTKDPNQGWKITSQNPFKILIPEGRMVKFKAGSELSKAVNKALPTGNVVVKDMRRRNIVSEGPYREPQGIKLDPGVYAIDGAGCLAANIPHDEILTGDNVITITPYNPFTTCKYPVNGTLFVVGNYSVPRELSQEELAKIQREIPETRNYSEAIGIPAGDYKITTEGFGLAMVDAETGEIIGEALLREGSDIRKDITINPVSKEFFLALMGGTPEATKVGCWLVETDEDGNITLNMKEKCNSPVLLRVSPESSTDVPKVERIPLEEGDVFVGEDNITITRITISEEEMGKRGVKRIMVDIEGPNDSADTPFGPMKLKDVLEPESAVDMFVKIEGIDGEANSTAWGFPLTVNETTAFPGPYNPFLTGILEPLNFDASFIPVGIGGANFEDVSVPSAVGERIFQPDYGASDEKQIPFVIIIGGEVKDGIPEFSMEIPRHTMGEHTLDGLIIEVLTLREPTTGEESVVAFVKLIGADGRFDYRSEISKVEDVTVLEVSTITINEEDKHK